MLLQQRTTTKPMKKLLLMAVAISGLALFPAQRSDAQVFVQCGVEGLSFGFPGGYYAHRGILIITTTGILYGRMSAIRSRFIRSRAHPIQRADPPPPTSLPSR